MKTNTDTNLTDIKNHFKNVGDVVKVVCKGECEDYGKKYYFLDYAREDRKIKSIDGNYWVGVISRCSGGYTMTEKWYDNQDKFDNAMKRILKKQ